MKKLIYIIWAFCLGLQGCEQDPEYEYDDIDRIYFQYEVQNSLGNNVSVDSVVFSFGKLPEEVVADTAKIVVQLMGNVSEQPRKYRVKVLLLLPKSRCLGLIVFRILFEFWCIVRI